MNTASPSSIRNTAIALTASLISTLIAVYFDGLTFEELSFNDPWILGANFIWALVIAWIIWDLLKGRKGVPLTLILVGIIMLAALIWDFSEFGFNIAQVFYAIEIVLFAVAYYFITTPPSQAWLANQQSNKEDSNG